MITGLVFDIKEFAVHDGPGIRTTVFLKGCPLSCTWCHNPEGQSRQSQVMRGRAGTRLAGTEYAADELARLLNRQAPILKGAEGGVTFSGGEPLSQARFVAEVIARLNGLHVVLDTSGFGSEEDFRLLLRASDLVYYDLKLVDAQLHLRFTGCDNAPILRNLEILNGSGVPFVIRLPLVPGVTDTEANLEAVAQIAARLEGLLRVDLLPYNKAAGAKYEAAGIVFRPGYNEARPLNINTAIFDAAGVKVIVA